MQISLNFLLLLLIISGKNANEVKIDKDNLLLYRYLLNVEPYDLPIPVLY